MGLLPPAMATVISTASNAVKKAMEPLSALAGGTMSKEAVLALYNGTVA